MVNEYAKNQNHTLLIGEESTFGTGVSTTKDIGLVQSINIDENNNTSAVFSSGARTAAELVDGDFSGKATVSLLLQHGRIFEYLFGGTTTHSDLTGGDYKHTFSVGNDLKSFTMENAFNLSTDAGKDHVGCKINSLTVEMDLGGTVSVTAEIMYKASEATSSTGSAVISTLKTFKSFQASLSTGTDSSETSIPVERFKITFTNDSEEIRSIGSRTPDAIVPNNLKIDFEFTKSFQNNTEYVRFSGSGGTVETSLTAFSLIINANNGVAAGSGRQEMNFDFNNVKYSSYGEAKSVDGRVIQTFKGVAKGLTDCFITDTIASGSW